MLLDRVKGQIKALFEAGHQIVVMEAAVLLQAGWDKHVHEIWACIIPPEEVTGAEVSEIKIPYSLAATVV